PPRCLATGHHLCRHRRFLDADERSAAADVAVEPLVHLLFGRSRILLEEGNGRHDETWRAEPAHQRIDVAERLLDRMQRVAGRETFDRADLFALNVDRERRARIDRSTVDDHRARTARAAVAPALVAGHVAALSNGIEQRDARFDLEVETLA